MYPTSTTNQTLINNHDLCTLETCPISFGLINYVPGVAGNAVYIGIFAVLLALQLGLGIFYRTWGFLVGMFCGLVLEVIGYAGRIWLSKDIFDLSRFLMYLVPITIGPAFITASIYLCLGRIVVATGQNISKIKPRVYTITFITGDLISLILQAAGGALASSDDQSTSDTGVNIMIAGLAFQVFSISVFAILWADFAWRAYKTPDANKNMRYAALRNSMRFKLFQVAMASATLLIFIRCVYRVIELAGGFNGALANNETDFMVLEGPMIFVAVGLLTIFHPGFSFKGLWGETTWALRPSKEGADGQRLLKEKKAKPYQSDSENNFTAYEPTSTIPK